MDVRIPPHNLDAEKAVLGALLTNGSNMGAVVDTVTSILKSEDFLPRCTSYYLRCHFRNRACQ